MLKKDSTTARIRHAAVAPLTPKRSPAHNRKGMAMDLLGDMTPLSCASKYQRQAPNPATRKSASTILLGDLMNLSNSPGLQHHDRMNGVRTSTAITSLPHQTLQEVANEWLIPK